MTVRPPRVFIGTGAIAYKEWKGRFYPKDLPADRAFSFYAKTFSALEVNNTFYRMPTPREMTALASAAPKKFPIAVKAPQIITHMKRLKNAAGLVRRYFKALAALKDRLGPALIQLPPNFKKDMPRLEKFFTVLPKGFDVAMEFRHPTWFTDDVFSFLRKKKAALVYNDADVDMPFVSTADWGFLRLRRLRYTDSELAAWKKKIAAQKWKRAFVIFKHEQKVTAPALAERFKR